MDNVIEKKAKHAELCKLLAAEGYEVMLLPFPREALGHFLTALIQQQNIWTS
jgi:hypothetical protein